VPYDQNPMISFPPKEDAEHFWQNYTTLVQIWSIPTWPTQLQAQL